MVLFIGTMGLSEARGFCSPGRASPGFRVLTAVRECVHPECSRALFKLQVAKGLFIEERASGLGRPEETSSGEKLLI